MMGFVLVGGLIGGALLFGWACTIYSVLLFMGLLVGSDIAAYCGTIPYAPVYRTLAEGAQHMPPPDGL